MAKLQKSPYTYENALLTEGFWKWLKRCSFLVQLKLLLCNGQNEVIKKKRSSNNR